MSSRINSGAHFFVEAVDTETSFAVLLSPRFTRHLQGLSTDGILHLLRVDGLYTFSTLRQVASGDIVSFTNFVGTLRVCHRVVECSACAENSNASQC